MIRIRLCQKLPLKLKCVRASSSPASALSIEAFSSAPIDLSSSPPSRPVHWRHKSCVAAPRPLNVEPREKPHSFHSYFLPQSITPYRFDDVSNHDAESGTTHVHVLEQWKLLLESLKTVVEGFGCTRTAVQDVSAIRLALERHHLVKLLVKPYSYTAEDVLNSASQQSLHVVLDPHGFPKDAEIGSIRQNEVAEVSVTDTVNTARSQADRCESLVELHQRSCIDRLEQESLRAVMVLTTGAWKYPVENASASCVGSDSTWTRSTEAQLAETSTPAMLCKAGESGIEGEKPTGSKGQRRPNHDQLCAVQNYMADNLPKIFVKFHSYDIYKNDLIFENNWYMDKSYITVGTLSYALEIAKLRLFVHLRYANVRMQLLKITTHEEDGTVRIRWRIAGIPQAKAMMFWNFLPWANKSSAAEDFEWLDGFSTFFVDDTGLIYKHRMDRVIPDEGIELKTNQTVIEKIATKIAAPPSVATLG